MASASGGEPRIGVTQLNEYLLFFFAGRDTAGAAASGGWVADSAMKLGIGTYAIHRGEEALVYDTFTSLEQARWVRGYLENLGVKRFTVVLSHWHLDHIAGNAVYRDSPILSCSLTLARLREQRAAIESGTLWGPPAITPVVLPSRTFESQERVSVSGLEVVLYNLNIHSKDSTFLYLPRDKLALIGDMLEDPLTYMVEVEELPNHLKNLEQLREWDITRFFPNHGDPAVIARGGYDKTLIDATRRYLSRMLTHAHDADFLATPMEAFIGDSLADGWVHAFEPYRDVHRMNLGLVQKYYQDKKRHQRGLESGLGLDEE